MSSPSSLKRAKTTPDELYPAAYPSAAPEHPKIVAPTYMTRLSVDILNKIFEFSDSHTFARCYSVCRTFKAVNDRPAMQRVFCGLLGIVPSDKNNRAGNLDKCLIAEYCIRHFRLVLHGSLPLFDLRDLHRSAFAPLQTPESETIVTIPFLMRTARSIQTALSQSPLVNSDLQRLILQSSPQDTLLPFFLLAPSDYRTIISTFQMSNLAFRLVLNRCEAPACTLLANRFKSLPPALQNKLFFQNLFTDALYDGNTTLETIGIFYDLGARPEKTALEYFFTKLGADQEETDLEPYNGKLLKFFLSFDFLITEKVIETILRYNACLFDVTVLRELLMKFIGQGKKELPASFLTAMMTWAHCAEWIDHHDEEVARKAVNDRIALLLECGGSVEVQTLFECAQVALLFRPHFITQENQDNLFSRFDIGKPTPEVAQAFYEDLGFLRVNVDSDFEPILILAQAWFKRNGFPPSADTLLTSLKEGVTSPSCFDRIDRSSVRSCYCSLGRILDFHAVDTDPGITPDRQIMLLLYFIQIRTIGITGFSPGRVIHLHDIKPLIKEGAAWLKKHGFELDVSTKEDFEKYLKEFIKIFSDDKHKHKSLLLFVIDLLEKIGYEVTTTEVTTTTEAIFNLFPDRMDHLEFREWRCRNRLLSLAGMPIASLRSLPAPALPAPPPG